MPVEGAIIQGQRGVTAFSAAIIRGDGVARDGHQDWHGWDRLDVDESREVAGNANVSAAVDKLGHHSRGTVPAKTEYTRTAADVDDGTVGWRVGIEGGLENGEIG